MRNRVVLGLWWDQAKHPWQGFLCSGNSQHETAALATGSAIKFIPLSRIDSKRGPRISGGVGWQNAFQTRQK